MNPAAPPNEVPEPKDRNPWVWEEIRALISAVIAKIIAELIINKI